MGLSLLQTRVFASALRNSMQLLLLLIIFELGAFPSSKLLLLKLVTIALFFFLLMVAWALEFVVLDKKPWLIFAGFVLLMIFSLYVSMMRDASGLGISIRAFLSYVGVALCAVGLYTSYSLKLITYRQIFLCFIFAVSCWVVIKLVVMFSPFLLGISPSAVRAYLAGSIAIEYRTEDTMFFRISTGNDLLTTFAIYLLLFNKEYGVSLRRGWRRVLILLLSLGMLLSFTRYLWLSGLLVAIFYAYKNRVLLKNSILIALILILFGVISIILELGIVDEMFTRMGDVTSISTKREQASMILNEVNNYPVLGKGIGGYVEGYVRSRYLPFQYETQLLALWMQLGSFGILLLIVTAISPVFPVMKDVYVGRLDKVTLGLSLLYLLFLSSSLTNPNLFILNVALIYFIVASSVMRRGELVEKGVS